MKRTLSVNQIRPGIQVNGATGNGGSQPPRKRIVAIAHIVVIAMYSPRKNSRNGVEEYSTAKPATSSDSASGRSNGGRLVSASAETKKTMNIGSSFSQCQSMSVFGNPARVPGPYFCAFTMSVRLSEPTHSSTVMMTKPIETS